MPSNSTTVFPPLGKTVTTRTATPSQQQRAKTAHTASSLPLAGSARVSTHPLLPPHHMKRRQPHHHHRQHLQSFHSPQTHRRHVSETARESCTVADHLVGLSDAPEMPEISDLLRQGAVSRATIVDMIEQGICRTSFSDVQRFPAIHPSIMSARMERIVRYITFVTAPPIERRAPKDRPKSWDRKVFKRLGPEECFRCQLQTEHAVCERHKYLRVGGGFRHSYWYIKQTMDILEAEHRKVAEEVMQRYKAELALKARQAQTRRKIKTYVRGADRKLVSRYCFVTEEEYREMKKDSKRARKILGLAEDEELEDWVSSKQKYMVDEKGEIVKVTRRKVGDSAYEESIESADVNNNYGKDGRRKGRKGRHHRRYSDSDSFESGMGNSILEEEGERGRRRRHGRRGRHGSGGRYSSVESVESYVSEGGTRRERTVRRRHRRRSVDSYESSYYEDEDGRKHRRRRRHRRRSYSGSDSGTGLDSGDSRRSRRGRHRRGRHGHRRHRGRHYDDDDYSYDSSGSYDSRDGGGRGRGGRRRGGRRRYSSSYSDDSDDSRSRRRNRRRHRRRYRSYSDESDLSGEDGEGRRRRRRGRHHRSRHHSGHSSGSSDYSHSDRSRRRDGRHRRRHRRHHGSDDTGSWSDGSSDGRRDGRRRGRRHRRRRYDSESEDEDYYDGEDGARGGRRRRRRRRRSSSYSDSYSDSEGRSGNEKGRSRRRKHRRRYYSDDSDVSYDSDDDYDNQGRKKKGRRRRRRHHRGSGSDSGTGRSSGSEGSSFGLSDHGARASRRRRHAKNRGRRPRSGRGGSGDRSLSDGSSYPSESGLRSRGRKNRASRNRTKGKRGARGSYSSGSSFYSSDDFSSSESLPVSSEVSDASDPSSVHSSDISDIDSDLDEEERERIKAEKKAKKMEEKRAAKQQLKVQTRKEAREAKREKIRQEKKERRRERRERRGEDGEGRGRRRDRRDKRRRHRTPTSRSISSCSSVSSVGSDEISDVDSDLVGEERERAIEAKKAKKKAEKKEMKQKEKVQKVQEEHREKRREKERKRLKREIEREMDRMSSPSDVSSVRSSELSSLSEEDEDLTEEERARRKAEKKKKKKEEKKQEKKLLKAVQRVMAKRRNRRGSGSSDDSYARGKQDFYDLPPEVRKTMVKYSKGSKRGLVDEEAMEWLDEWKDKSKREGRKKKSKKKKEEFTGETVELKAPDGRVIRVPKTSLYDVWRQTKKIRLKKDGTVARDSDSDAETIELDSDGNMVTQPKTVPLTEPGHHVKWEGFAPTPEPPMTPTQGGKIKFQGVRKVQHAFRRDKGVLMEHLRRVLDTASELSDPRAGDRAEAKGGHDRGAWESVDFLNHFRLVEPYKLDPLGRAFVVEDVDYDCSLTAQEMRAAVEGVPSLSSIKPKQLDYVLKVLNIDDHTAVSFKMFAVVAGVCERMCSMDSFGKYILDKTDLLDIARKMALYKSIFYCNVNSERSENHITAESLRIELMAGGLNREQERYIMSKMNPNEFGEISFFDYIAYIPLFLSMHENIIDNPLDRREKYGQADRSEVQRDMNPLGLPLQRTYLSAPKEIFPSGIPIRSAEGGSAGATGSRRFIESGELLDGAVVGGPKKTGRFPSIAQKSPSPLAAKRSERAKNTSLSLP